MRQLLALGLLAPLVLAGCSTNSAAASPAESSNAAASANTPEPTAPAPPSSMVLPHIDGEKAYDYTRQVVSFGPRYLGSAGHAKVEQYLRSKLKGDDPVEDSFTMQTPVGPKPMRNFIAKFPGTKAGIVVVAGHYDTLYGRDDFVGANDGGASTGILLAIADQLRSQMRGKKLDGYSVWLVWLDAEEAIKQWSDTDSIYGARHLADKWKNDGTAPQIKAFILEDMIGDKDLGTEDEGNSSPELRKIVYQAATQLGVQSHFFVRQNAMEDDHLAFKKVGIPVVDLIDYNYGYNNSYWHTADDTMDKISPQSLQMVGDVTLLTIRLLAQR